MATFGPDVNAMWEEYWAKEGNLPFDHFGGMDLVISNCTCLVSSLLSLYLVSIKEDKHSQQKSPENNEIIFFSSRVFFEQTHL